jgi:uncharacterized protein YjbI with pentapeptide repeats
MHNSIMKRIIPLILSTLLLTSCSGPDSSGGVEFSKTANVFPFGSCRGPGYQTHSTKKRGCGWITVDENNYYIMPFAILNNAILTHADLRDANLSGANLYGAELIDADLRDADLMDAILMDAILSYADLRGVEANSRTICPNGIKWGTSGNDCPF